MSLYQIIAFENHEVYDSQIVSSYNALEKYVKMCEKYVPPEFIIESETQFEFDTMYVKYTDKSGDDKPMMILMFGSFSIDMINHIKIGLKKIYNK